MGVLTRSESAWVGEAIALFQKDVRAELRTRVALSAVGVFTFAALMLLALATRDLRDRLIPTPVLVVKVTATGKMMAETTQYHPAWDSPAKMGMLWVLLCFAAFAGLAHSFVHEEEAGTTTALRLSLGAGAVYAGKLAFNLLLLVAVAVVITPAFMLVTGMQAGPLFVFLSVMLGGCVGLAATATIIGALAAKARSTGALYGAIGLPILVVFLLMLQNAANTLYKELPALRIVKDVGGLWSFGILLIAVSALTFHFVWEE